MTLPSSPVPTASGSAPGIPSSGDRTAKVTAADAPYVTRPTKWTRFTRTFVPWQLWRFARINLKMIGTIRSSRT